MLTITSDGKMSTWGDNFQQYLIELLNNKLTVLLAKQSKG